MDREPSPARSTYERGRSLETIGKSRRVGGRCEPGTARGPSVWRKIPSWRELSDFGFPISSLPKGPAALHHLLQFFEHRRQLRLRLGRALAVEGFQTDGSYFGLQLRAQRSISARRPVGWLAHFGLRVLQPPHGVINALAAFFFGQLLEGG